MLATDFVTLLIPLWILLFLLLLLGVLALLGRIQNGRYLRPLFALMSKVPLLRRWLQKASEAAMERSNPELASAMRKMQRSGALRDPQRAQAAMSQLQLATREDVARLQASLDRVEAALNDLGKRLPESKPRTRSRAPKPATPRD